MDNQFYQDVLDASIFAGTLRFIRNMQAIDCDPEVSDIISELAVKFKDELARMGDDD